MQLTEIITGKQIIEFLNATVYTNAFHNMEFSKISSLKSGDSSSISFFSGGFMHLKDLKNTKVGACLIKENDKNKIPSHTIPIIVKDPYLSITNLVTKYIGTGEKYPTQYITPSAENNLIAPNSSISINAKIGKNVRIMPFVYIGENVEIEDNVTIHSHVSLEHCKIGANSTIRSGAKIGSCGFGFVPNYINGQHIPIPQISNVIIEESVDIGANSTIDRGFLNDTTIGKFTKIDNMVHIGHGTKIGNSCFIAGCCVVAGSVEIGDFCMIGGQSVIAGGAIIPNKTQIMGFSGVITGPSKEGKIIAGIPAVDAELWKKMHVLAMQNAKNRKK